MKKISLKSIIALIYVAFFIFCGILAYFEDSEISLNPNDYARITDVNYQALVSDKADGKILVTERITFDIHAASDNNHFYELWRDLPEDYVDGVKVEYKVNYVKEILQNGKEKIYTESPKLYWNDSDYTSPIYGPGKWFYSPGPYDEEAGDYEAVMIYVDKYREQPVFEIQYEMTNAALRYNDCSELYLSMYSESTIKYLKSFKGQILFPNKVMPDEDYYFAHTYGTNNNEFPFNVSKKINPGYTTFSFDLNESDLKFKPYNQYIEFSLVSFGKDAHIFTKRAPSNLYSNTDVLEETIKEQEKYENQPYYYKKVKYIILCICSFLALNSFRTIIGADKRIRKANKFYEPEINYDYFREIPSDLDPIFASSLVFCKEKNNKKIKDEYAAILLNLARKGYIELEKIIDTKNWTTDNIKIIVKQKPESEIILNTTIENNESNEPQAFTASALKIFNEEPSLADLEIFNNNESEDSTNIDQTYYKEINKLEPLATSERLYLNLVLRYATKNDATDKLELKLADFQSKVSSDYENTNSFVTNMENISSNIGTINKYFQKKNYTEPKDNLKSTGWYFIIIGILSITLVNFISHFTRLDFAFGAFTILGIVWFLKGFYYNNISHRYILLTQLGENEYAKWRGLYNFLNSETLINERTVVELPLWEKYLVYATAFGISEKVIKAINIRCTEIDSSKLLSNPYYRNNSFYLHTRSFRSSTHTASSIARSGGYGGYGGHGGYGGGGRGGGGGRRRSLTPHCSEGTKN